jgi:hypothetical protein
MSFNKETTKHNNNPLLAMLNSQSVLPGLRCNFLGLQTFTIKRKTNSQESYHCHQCLRQKDFAQQETVNASNSQNKDYRQGCYDRHSCDLLCNLYVITSMKQIAQCIKIH